MKRVCSVCGALLIPRTSHRTHIKDKPICPPQYYYSWMCPQRHTKVLSEITNYTYEKGIESMNDKFRRYALKESTPGFKLKSMWEYNPNEDRYEYIIPKGEE